VCHFSYIFSLHSEPRALTFVGTVPCPRLLRRSPGRTISVVRHALFQSSASSSFESRRNTTSVSLLRSVPPAALTTA